MMNTFYWHDYETWGTSPKWDRAAQFAGIRTDWELNIIGEPAMFYCQPADDMLPHPGACMVTGISPQKAKTEGFCEADFFKQIHAEFSRPGTCGAGYNSLRFDDEFTRYGFYRNFIDPYAREWQNGNSRWDLIDVVRLTRALRPEGINWPEREDEPGVPSFKLEHLTAANHIEHAGAHDALVDVIATIEMAKLIRRQQPKLFEFCLNLRNKLEAAKQLNVNNRRPLLHISRMIPARLGCISPVLPVAAHPGNKNSVIVYDLRHDPADLLSLNVEEIVKRLFVSKDDLPDGEQRIALKEVHLNKAPVLSPMSTLTDEAASEWQIDRQQVNDYAAQLIADRHLELKVKQVFAANIFAAETDPDAMLYDGFIQAADRDCCNRVLESAPENLHELQKCFKDSRLPELLFRYRARNWPETLKPTENSQWQSYRKHRLQDVDNQVGINLKSYRQELARLSIDESLDEKQRQLIDDLINWPIEIDV